MRKKSEEKDFYKFVNNFLFKPFLEKSVSEKDNFQSFQEHYNKNQLLAYYQQEAVNL